MGCQGLRKHDTYFLAAQSQATRFSSEIGAGLLGSHWVEVGSRRNQRWVEGNTLDLLFSDGYFNALTVVYGLCNVENKELSRK